MLGVFPTVFKILTHKGRKQLVFPTPPLFDAPVWGIPSELLDETYPTKTRGMELLYGENCMIVTSTVLTDPSHARGHTGYTSQKGLKYTGWPKKTKLSYFVHIFAKYWPIFTIFSPVDSAGNLLLIGMHTTPTVLLHYLVKQKYPKNNNIIQSLVVTSMVVGQFKEIPVRKLTY